MLADLATLKTFLRLTDNTQDQLLPQLLVAADRVVKLWTKRDLETSFYTGVDAEYQNGNGYMNLNLLQRPVQASPPGLTGTWSNGSPVITGLSLNAQTYLAAGMPVQTTGAAPQSSVGAWPQGATVVSVDSATQVTCSANATLPGSACPLVFGLRVFLDPAGFAGDGVGAFALGTGGTGLELFLGLNYALARDSRAGRSRGATLTRLGGGVVGSTISGFWPGERPSGFLSAKEGPFWPRGIRNVKVEYAAGLGVGAAPGQALPDNTTLPAELTTAVCMVAGFMRTLVPVGVPLDYEAAGRQALMQMLAGEKAASPTLGTVLSLLRPYREFVA
jgi:hypothetical protein